MSPKLRFQPDTTQQNRVLRSRVEDAFILMIQNSAEADFSRLFDVLDDMQRMEETLYRSLRGNMLLREVFNTVDQENRFRIRAARAEREKS